jgi:predicted enzyme related to lactoylglutathione lyase
MLNLNSIMIGTNDSKALADFYEKVLEKKPDMAEEGWYGFSAGSCFISIGNHDKVKGKSTNPERVILNLETAEVEKEFARIKALGATVVAEPYTMGEGKDLATIATFADPDGNYFQLMTPWKP